MFIPGALFPGAPAGQGHRDERHDLARFGSDGATMTTPAGNVSMGGTTKRLDE